MTRAQARHHDYTNKEQNVSDTTFILEVFGGTLITVIALFALYAKIGEAKSRKDSQGERQ